MEVRLGHCLERKTYLGAIVTKQISFDREAELLVVYLASFLAETWTSPSKPVLIQLSLAVYGYKAAMLISLATP